METEVGTIKGYTILYDSARKTFILQNEAGDEVGRGPTQEAVEAEADKLAKAGFELPIKALLVSGLDADIGRVTSVNIGDRSCTFVFDDKTGYRSRAKIHLAFPTAYELTAANTKVWAKIQAKAAIIEAIEKEIREWLKTFEKPINYSYFGLKPPY